LELLSFTDFNRLPVPFEAMATDIETGDSVVLHHDSVAPTGRAARGQRECVRRQPARLRRPCDAGSTQQG
jgi:hypothetical protein